MTEFDHLLWAAPDLDDGIGVPAAATGVTPVPGGAHPGFGTRNALLSLGSSYLEVISPDPAQDLAGNRGGRIAGLPRPGLLTFAVRTPDLAGFAAAARAAGLSVGEPVAMSRRRPDGLLLAWAVQHASSDAHLDLVPFAIDWRG
ncbi:VOC family protein, partial [Salmonella enterica]|nr:VOC family protein [Salmonella enterica]